MRNAIYMGMCWAMTLGLVAVALGQQQSEKVWRNQPFAAPQTIDTTGMPIENAMQPPQRSDRSVLSGSYQPDAGMDDGKPRGELGVWMGETGGPGVRILRITGGSAAEQAGLRVGDVILQVNGQGASSPHDTAALIRKIAIGQKGNLMVWRDGNQQQMQVTLQPTRQVARQTMGDASHQAGFGRGDSADSDLASRTMKLEQQINSLTQELATLRQELAQLRTAGPVQTGYNAEANQSAPPQPPQDRYKGTLKAPAPGPETTTAPPGFGAPAEKPAAPPADAAKPAAAPAAPPAPAAEKSASNDLFGSDPAKPKSEEKPKAEGKGGTDDLFK